MPPLLHASSHLIFKVIVPERDYDSSQYIERVKAFREGIDTGHGEEVSSALTLQSAEQTQLPTGNQTPAAAHPTARPFLTKPLGAGAFGVVMFRFYFSTGDETAVKSPPKPSSRDYPFRLSDWKNEADMLQSISHSYYKRCSVELDSDLLRLVSGMMLVGDPARRSSAKEVETAAGTLLQGLGSDPATTAAPARIVVFSGGLGLTDNGSINDASDSSETPDPPGEGTWDWDSKEQLVWIPKYAKEGAVEEVASPHGNTVDSPHGSTVAGSLWNAGSSLYGPGTPQEADDLPYDDRTVHLAGRKRSLPESLSEPRSLQLPADRPLPSPSRGPPGPKLARRNEPSRREGRC